MFVVVWCYNRYYNAGIMWKSEKVKRTERDKEIIHHFLVSLMKDIKTGNTVRDTPCDIKKRKLIFKISFVFYLEWKHCKCKSRRTRQ